MKSKKEVEQYARLNFNGALGFLYSADEDYVAARCCILNALYSGFTLAAQAIEKTLKAFIYLESGIEVKQGHDPYKLKIRLQQYKNYNLDRFDNILKKLNDHYQSRYHDNDMTYATNGAAGKELIAIDKLWLHLKDVIPMPDEVKYRTKFFSDICEHPSVGMSGHWLIKDNSALLPKLSSYRNKYLKVNNPAQP